MINDLPADTCAFPDAGSSSHALSLPKHISNQEAIAPKNCAVEIFCRKLLINTSRLPLGQGSKNQLSIISPARGADLPKIGSNHSFVLMPLRAGRRSVENGLQTLEFFADEL